MTALVELHYEIFGRVQGVYYRRYTANRASTLGLVGWIRNTPYGTVEGVAQGPADKIHTMKIWFRNKGSPESQVTSTEYKEKEIEECTFTAFDILRYKQ